MNIEFISGIPKEFKDQTLLISGEESVKWDNVEYLILKDGDIIKKVLEIRFKSHCSPFKDVLLRRCLLAIGHQRHFYLYDLLQNTSLLILEMDGYFGHLYVNENLFYVTGSGSVYCIGEKGNLIWKNSGLGVDGVLIEKFSDNKIYGSGECDPPAGWQDFVLDITTGRLISQ
jgi:hypothetical protein